MAAYGLDDHGYVPLEAEASTVRIVTLTYPPGLLQTADYTRAMFQASVDRRTATELDNSVVVRTLRQERLTSEDDPLELVTVLDEAALHRPVGGPEVMRAQLAHLVEAAALPAVTLQVLPRCAGAHPSMSAGFIVLSFGGLGVPDMAYVEHPLGAVHIEKEADVTRARLTFDRLRSLALSPDESVALIGRLAEQM